MTSRTRQHTDDGASAAIDVAAVTLRLPTVRRHADTAAEEAVRSGLTHRRYLAELLTAEVEDRNERLQRRRIKEARFPRTKTVDEFDTTRSPIAAATIAELACCRWIDDHRPLILLGDSGTGKTHLLIALGTAAARQGRRVRYSTAAQLVNELAAARTDGAIAKTISRYARYDLLCLDELGYLHLDPIGAELLFQTLTERDEQASIAVATNLPFSEWGQVFPDPRLAAAVVDRLTYKAHILETGSDSYRLRQTETTTTRRRPTSPTVRGQTAGG